MSEPILIKDIIPVVMKKISQREWQAKYGIDDETANATKRVIKEFNGTISRYGTQKELNPKPGEFSSREFFRKS